MLSVKPYQQKLFTLIGVSMLTISSVVMTFGYFMSKHSTMDKLEKSALQELQLKKQILLKTIDEAKTMIYQLKNTSVIQLVHTKEPLCVLGNQFFTSLSNMYPPMMSIKFLDATSKEIFRIDKIEASGYLIQNFDDVEHPTEECGCYQHAHALDVNDIWISEIKNNAVKQTASLVLASPFFDESAQSFGLIVLEVDLNNVLKTLKDSELFKIGLVNKVDTNATTRLQNASHSSVVWEDGFLHMSDLLLTTNENTVELHLRSNANLNEILQGIGKIFIIIFIITFLLSYVLSFVLSRVHMSMVKKINARENLLIQESKLVEIGSMTTYLTHQWKQPLNELATTMVLVKRELNEVDKPHSFLNEKVDQCEIIIESMGETIDTFARFYRFSKQEEIFDVKEALEQVLPIVSNSLNVNAIYLNRSFEENISIFGYRNEYMHVILSLLNNSIEAYKHVSSERLRQLSIVLWTKEDEVCITIEDNAGGIDRSLTHDLFKKYATSNHSGNNSGLGLYFAKIIIEERFKGSISFHTNEIGTLFRITHPKLTK